jgi:hypothetical protein
MIFIQIIAKKVIASMWLFLAALQLTLLLTQQANMQLPATVDMVLTTISGIINLSTLD